MESLHSASQHPQTSTSNVFVTVLESILVYLPFKNKENKLYYDCPVLPVGKHRSSEIRMSNLETTTGLRIHVVVVEEEPQN